MSNPMNENAQASVERVRQEVERWIDAARTAGERTLDAIGLSPVIRSCTPAVDVLETGDAVYVWVDVPGLTSDAVQLAATPTQLVVKLQRIAGKENEGKYHLRERAAASSERIIPLPNTVDPDQTTARLYDGLLYVTLKKQIAPEPRSVPVNVR
jgi:HSP20 family protein